MLICSDWIWEYLSSEQVMNIANEYYLINDPFDLFKELTEKSNEIWMKESEGGDVDDILFFLLDFEV